MYQILFCIVCIHTFLAFAKKMFLKTFAFHGIYFFTKLLPKESEEKAEKNQQSLHPVKQVFQPVI